LTISISTRALCVALLTCAMGVAAPAAAAPEVTSSRASAVGSRTWVAQPASQAGADTMAGCASSGTARRTGDAGLGVLAVVMGLLLVLGARTRRMAG